MDNLNKKILVYFETVLKEKSCSPYQHIIKKEIGILKRKDRIFRKLTEHRSWYSHISVQDDYRTLITETNTFNPEAHPSNLKRPFLNPNPLTVKAQISFKLSTMILPNEKFVTPRPKLTKNEI